MCSDDVRDLRESNHRIAARIDSLDAAVRDLGRDIGSFRTEVATQNGGLRTETTSGTAGLRGEMAAINANLEKFQARTDATLRMAGWGVALLTPILGSLLGVGFWITWHAAKLDARVERVESRLDKEPTATPSRPIPPANP